MAITTEYVATLFNYLRNGQGHKFFDHVADNVSWTVMGSHPLAGYYHTKQDFLAHTFERLNKILNEGVILKVNNIIVHENIAVVEMENLSTAKNGRPFHNTYCWVVRFEGDTIVEVRAYVDSALLQQLIAENE